MPEPVINEDELVGYILRRVNEVHGTNLMYEDVRYVLDAEIHFLLDKGIAEDADKAER